MTDFDEDLKNILEQNWDETIVEKPRIIMARDVRMIDLQAGHFIITEDVGTEEEFFGIGAADYLVRSRARLTIRTGESPDRAEKMLEVVRKVLRNKQTWGAWQNLRIAGLECLMEREKKIYAYVVDVEAMRSESA